MERNPWGDLVERLSSRKLWLCLLSVGFAAWNHAEGRLSAVEFQQAVFAAISVYTISEAATDAVAAYRPKPASLDTQTVNVGSDAAVAATPLPPPPDAPHGPQFDDPAIEEAYRIIRAEEAAKRRARDARRRQATPADFAPVVQASSAVRRPRPPIEQEVG